MGFEGAAQYAVTVADPFVGDAYDLEGALVAPRCLSDADDGHGALAARSDHDRPIP